MPCWQPRQGPGTVPEALDETSQPKHGLCHQVPSRSPPLLSHLIAMATSAQLARGVNQGQASKSDFLFFHKAQKRWQALTFRNTKWGI